MRKKNTGEICLVCDGCGWTEGGKTLQTKCNRCNGTGIITEESERKFAKQYPRITKKDFDYLKHIVKEVKKIGKESIKTRKKLGLINAK